MPRGRVAAAKDSRGGVSRRRYHRRPQQGRPPRGRSVLAVGRLRELIGEVIGNLIQINDGVQEHLILSITNDKPAIALRLPSDKRGVDGDHSS